MKENPVLISELRELIVNHLKSLDCADDIYALSKRCGVGPSTIRRILNGQSKLGPQGNTILGIVSGVTGEKNIQRLVHSFDGEIGIKLKECYQNIMGQTEYVPEYSNILSDRIAYVVFKLSSNRRGTTEENIKKLMGIPALDTVRELRELGLIEKKEDGKIYSKKQSYALPENVIKKHIAEMVRFSNYGSDHVDKSCFYSISDSISVDAYESIRKILVSSVKEIREVLRSEESVGDVPFFLTSVLDTMEVPTENLD